MTVETATEPMADTDRIQQTVKQYWGYDTLRPLQAEAIQAGMEQRDSLVVMPTGGGKSLCYQVPPVLAGRTDIVISPLISLMKDQVDGLRACGYPAAAVHSNLEPGERLEIVDGINNGRYRLLFVSPERLVTSSFMQMLGRMDIKAFAIDEAHCISQWGHDFRPEYRQLATLKKRFPQASVHGFTATATPRVRKDIVQQLSLKDPHVLIGRFDRSNLVYRVQQRVDVYSQVIEIIRRHPKEAVIVYCISRKNTEALANVLKANGIHADFYHAGMDKVHRRSVQEAFAADSLDVVVATVAFGMGIDRSNVRCVIHAAMPKSVEHYQQETGRAGRDGLEAECVLLYSAADVIRWKELIQRSASEADNPEQAAAPQLELLNHIQLLCNSARCRHAALSEYFGQEYDQDNCGACDMCLEEADILEDSLEIAQKIISCVARIHEYSGYGFGVVYTVSVLRGANTEQIRARGHIGLSTYGILRQWPQKSLTNLVYQLIDLGLLVRTWGEHQVLELNEHSRQVMRGERTVQLLAPVGGQVHEAEVAEEKWRGVDRELFDVLRELRRSIASDRDVPAYVIFGDTVLRELAKVRPVSPESMNSISGVGKKKLADYGGVFVEKIADYCQQHDLSNDQFESASIVRPKQYQPNPIKDQALRMFNEGADIDAVAESTGRAASTVSRYLTEWIDSHRPQSVSAWVNDETYARVTAAAVEVQAEGRLKPIYEQLNEMVPYEMIRVVVAHQQAMAQ